MHTHLLPLPRYSQLDSVCLRKASQLTRFATGVLGRPSQVMVPEGADLRMYGVSGISPVDPNIIKKKKKKVGVGARAGHGSGAVGSRWDRRPDL